MTSKKAQTAPGEAVYKLHVSLRVPVDVDARARGEHARFHWLAEDTTAGESQLRGLVIPALVQGGFLEQTRAAELACATCAAHGSAAEKKERYSRDELAAHYARAHPGLTSEEV